MPLLKLQFRPGIASVVTGTTNEGGWREGNRVRFRAGFPQPIGGWLKYTTNQFLGICRTMHNWIALDGSDFLSVGTHRKYYIEEGGAFFDITPVRSTVVLNGPFAAVNGSAVITVTDVSHGAVDGDFVTFSGAASLGGTILAAILNIEYEISVIDDDSYTITASVAANASDTGTGGATVTANYQINQGLTAFVGGTGWGSGTWGRGGWGSGLGLTATNTLRIWSQDNYGEDLIFNVTNGQIYYWDKTSGLAVRAVTLESLSSDVTVPTIAVQVMVSDRDRHIILFGTDIGDGVQDPMLIRFSSQEQPFIWDNLPTNTAGELRLGAGSMILHALETKREIVIFTDTALYSMQFIGPPDTFGVSMLANNINSRGRLCHVAVDDVIYWMGHESFYVYDGRVTQLLCTLQDDIFDDIAPDESDKVIGTHNSEFHEVTWFYPSIGETENNRYVSFNYIDNTWTKGILSRCAWIDHGVRPYPIAATTDGYLYYHEIGIDDGSTVPVSSLGAYIESAPIDLAEGDQFMFIRRLIPDVDFKASTAASPTINMLLKTSPFPGANYNETTTTTTTQTSTTPIDQYTNQTHVRLRGRSVVFRVDSTTVGVEWILGSPRIDVKPDGRR